jgi:hypothetical protein
MILDCHVNDPQVDDSKACEADASVIKYSNTHSKISNQHLCTKSNK